MPCVVCGTTNRDEGGYLGFVGKASDGMVDLQIISDIHKSEVYQVARYLNVPQSVLQAAPTGDTYDGLVHEQTIEAPYDFIELYTYYLNLENKNTQERLINSLGVMAQQQFNYFAAKLEARHALNLHKYTNVSGPSIHFDVYARAVRGGCKGYTQDPLLPATDLEPSSFVGLFGLNPNIILALDTAPMPALRKEIIADFYEQAFLVHNLLSAREAQLLVKEVTAQQLIAVGSNGKLIPDGLSAAIGSKRCSTYNPHLAQLLWRRLAPQVPQLRFFDEYATSDWQQQPIWRAVGINPLFRFIVYPTGGHLIPHYDAGYDFKDGRRHTLMSVVLYLSENGVATTQLLHDKQRHLPYAERDFSDHINLAPEHAVLASIQATPGTALIMDHRILHQAQTWQGKDPRIILRMDIIFEVAAPPLTKAKFNPVLHSVPTPSQAHLLAKIHQDSYYAAAYKHMPSAEAMITAGFFDDGRDDSAASPNNPDFITTPLHKIIQCLNLLAQQHLTKKPRLLVLLTTGAFAPVHQGHLNAMQRAKQHLESQGAIVLGGYISPSHPDYLLQKYGAEAMPLDKRLLLCETAVAHSDWLMVDTWEALYNEVALNFTAVISHLEAYLSRHIKTILPLEVVYVFGSDNAFFCRAFLGKGQCVAVPRIGFETAQSAIAAEITQQFPQSKARVHILNSSAADSALSSTYIRTNSPPAAVQSNNSIWLGHVSPFAHDAKSIKLYLRDEEDWALAHWSMVDKQQLRIAWQQFITGLYTLLQTTIASTNPSLELIITKLSDQASIYAEYKHQYNLPLISLDPCLSGDYNIGISRAFSLANFTEKSQFVARIGHPELITQFQAIPPGKYILFDDDTATGSTLNYVSQNLAAHCDIAQILTLLDLRSLEPITNTIIDLIDARDFLIGTRDGGLTVRLPNNDLARAPYTLPYVHPSVRAPMALAAEKDFSSALWQLNLEFFSSITTTICVKDAHLAFVKLARWIGFNGDTPLESVCKWHLQQWC